MTAKRKKISQEQRKKEGRIHALYGKLYGCNLSGESLSRVIYHMRLSLSRIQLKEFTTSSYAKIPKVSKAIWGECYPKTIEKLGGARHYFFKAEDFRKEMNWFYVLVSLESKMISKYIQRRDEIEKLILLGQLSRAEFVLDETLKEFGYSAWYYEMKFLILARQDKEDKIWRLETEINEKKNQTSYFAYLIYSLAKRSMKNCSAFNYDAELDSQIERSRTSFLKDQCDFFHLFLNFYKNYADKDATAAISMVSPLSMVDRYNFFVNILRSSYVARKGDKHYITHIAHITYLSTLDKYLLPLSILDDKDIVPKEYYDSAFIEILDKYYLGEFDIVLQLCRQYIKNNPSNFDVIKVYVRTLIFEGKPYSPIVKGEHVLVSEIAQQIYEVLVAKDNTNELAQFYQLQKSISGLSIASGMDYFYKGERHIHPDITLYALSLYNYNPLFARLLETQEARLEYIKSGEKLFGELPFLSLCEQREQLEQIKDDRIYPNIRDAQNAAIVYQKGDYLEAIEKWSQILEDNEMYMPIAESAIQCIFDSYVKLGQNMNAIRFYVNKFLKGSAYVAKIDVAPFMKYLRNNHYRCGIKHSVDVLIFVFKNADREEQKSFILEKYWNYIGAKNSREFILKMIENNEPQAKVEKVLSQLLEEDILRHSMFVNSTKNQLEECQEICQYLSELNSDKHNLYLNWGAEFAYELQVYENMNKMDESRIYANTSAIFKYVLAEKEDLYRQFKYIYDMSGNGEYILYDGSTTYIALSADSENEYKRTSLAYSEIACQLFDIIRDAFLTSNFGLKTYLSTRIRHGVLENDIRQCFDGQHLLLESNGKQFVSNKWWRIKYGLKELEHTNLMSKLELLSKNVAKAIENFKRDVLQIKLEDKDSGMFVYKIERDNKVAAVIQADLRSKNYEEFCYMVMEILLQHTSTSLDRIREYVRKEFSKILDDILLNFEKMLDDYEKIPNFYAEIKSSVQHVRDALNCTIPRIESWFRLQEAHFEDFYLDENMSVVWNIINRSYSNIDVHVEVDVDKELHQKISSPYCMPFGDILTIIFSNMFQHSRKEHPREFIISGRMEDKYAHLHFENRIDGDEEFLNKRLKDLLTDDSRLQKEGGSGISKVKQILHYDLRCAENRIDMVAKGGVCSTDVYINVERIKV